MAYQIRAVESADDLEAFMVADKRGFSAHAPGTVRTWAEGELDRTRVAFDGKEAIGGSRAYSFELTLPGGAVIPVAAVSWVAVIPTHRRRGVLNAMMGALHDDARERGESAAVLTASESSIYGRYGYGVATWRLGLEAARSSIEFRDDIPTGGAVRFVEREEADRVMPLVYDEARKARAGMVSRPSFWWPQVFWGWSEGEDKVFFVVVHADDKGNDDGYVAYQVSGDWTGGLSDRRLLIWDMQATNAAARNALWQFIFGVDLIGTVAATNVPIDEPLRHLVRDGRRIRADFINDGLWLAPLDTAALLSARRYAREDHLVLAVHAPGDAVGTFELDGDENDAKCVPTTKAPDLTCSSATLGACALGGNRFTELAEAALVEEHTPGALLRADAMFATTPVPAMTSFF
jgi:predicted acetyltransferase